ncbi:MAG: hypothetical protein J1F63_09630 [Oscillospiraceae bacterium]|nr:hypothetical protein [Oscillospiraceae bacterium]
MEINETIYNRAIRELGKDNLTWMLERLPKNLPSKTVEDCLFYYGVYVSKLTVLRLEDRGPSTVVFTASDENELKHWLYNKLSKDIAFILRASDNKTAD